MFRVKTLKCAGKIMVAMFLSCLLLLSPFAYATPANAETEEKWFRSTPSEAVFDSLWVGDIVYFDSQIYEYAMENGKPMIGEPTEGNTMTVVSGDCVEITDIDLEFDFAKGLRFTKPGKAQVKIKETDAKTGESKEKTFSFTVTERPADKQIAFSSGNKLNLNLKIGERPIDAAPLKDIYTGEHDRHHLRDFLDDWFNAKFQNMNYGARAYKFLGNWKSEGAVDAHITYHSILDWTYGGYGGDNNYTYGGDDRIIPLGPSSFFYDTLLDGYAMRPGTIPLDVFIDSIDDLDEDNTKMGNVGTITVEEPEIDTNAPDTVEVGSSLRLTTALTNTALENLKTGEYEDESHYDSYDYEEYVMWMYNGTNNPIAYKPSVTVIEGSDCVTQSEQDYTNTLSSSETLTFQKPGTVKLKITYTQLATTSSLVLDYDRETWKIVEKDLRYNPEKIITIQVTGAGDPGSSDRELGDLSGDGEINAGDYMMLKRNVLRTFKLSAEQEAVADVNKDGEVNATDYMMLKRHVLGTYKIA